MDSIPGILGNSFRLSVLPFRPRRLMMTFFRILAIIGLSLWAIHLYHSQDYSTKGSSGHLLSQMDAIQSINHGHYLLDERTHESLLKTFTADFGAVLLLADRALISRSLSIPVTFTPDDIYCLQLVVVIITLVCLLLSALPLTLTLAAGLTLLGAYSLGIFGWDINDRWIPVITNLLTVLLISQLTLAPFRPPAWRSFLGLFLFSLFLGLLFSLRAEGKFVLLPALFLIGGTHFVFGFFKWLRLRQPTLPALRSAFNTHLSGIGAVLAVLLALMFVPKVFIPLNLSIFEKIEHVSHRPNVDQHVVWHPLYLGLGAVFHDFNYENIVWNDNSSYTQAAQIVPSIPNFETDLPSVEKIFKARYLRLIREYPTLFWTGLKYKTHNVLLNTYNRLNDDRLLIPFMVLAAALIALSAWCFAVAPFQLLLFSGALAAGLATAATLSILTSPATCPDTFHSLLLFAIVLGPMHLWQVIRNPEAKSSRRNGRRVFCGATLFAGFSAALLVSGLYFHVQSTEREAAQVFDRFAQGKLTYPDFLAYGQPSLIAQSFNEAPLELRAKLVHSVPIGEIHSVNASKNYRILNATWSKDELFLLIENLNPSDEFKYIPVFADPANVATMKRYPFFKNNVLLLPTSGFGKGIWLFHCHVSAALAQRILIGDIQYHPVDFDAYDRPLSSIAYEILNPSSPADQTLVSADPRSVTK